MTRPSAMPMRRSPVELPGEVTESVVRDGWRVTLRFRDPHPGPWLVDLSHRARWDYQDAALDDRQPFALPVPRAFGQVGVHGDLVIGRMNRTQVWVWHLGPGEPPASPSATPYTETTDGHCMVAFVGRDTPSVLEHLTPLDLFPPNRTLPTLTQGPVLHVPAQIVTFAPDLVVMTFSRGYGETFAEAALDPGAAAGLAPGGEAVFSERFSTL